MTDKTARSTIATIYADFLREYCKTQDAHECAFGGGNSGCNKCVLMNDLGPEFWRINTGTNAVFDYEKEQRKKEMLDHGEELRRAVDREVAKHHGKEQDDDHTITQEEIDALLNNSDDEYASVRAFVRMKEMERQQEEKEKGTVQYPQDEEPDEYRYIVSAWLDALAAGLTKGARKHPGETWRDIPSFEHAARAMRHLNKFRMGENNEDHLLNASMRCMMAWVTKEVQDNG